MNTEKITIGNLEVAWYLKDKIPASILLEGNRLCSFAESIEHNDETDAHYATMFADAGNIYSKTGKSPRELVEQNERLAEQNDKMFNAIKAALRIKPLWEPNPDGGMKSAEPHHKAEYEALSSMASLFESAIKSTEG